MKLTEKKWFTVVMCFSIWPVGLYLLWKKDLFPRQGKIILTIVAVIFPFFWLSGKSEVPAKQEVKIEQQQTKEETVKNEPKDTKPQYIIDIKESTIDPGEYSANSRFEAMASDDGTLGNSVIRMVYTLKYLQTTYPAGKWFYMELLDNNGKLIMASNFKNDGKVDLVNLSTNVELVKELMGKANVNIPREYRAKINSFIENNHIPMM
ncbi:MAG: hypothetical protein ACRC0S_07980 [Fusobacteriaceae bacterium]